MVDLSNYSLVSVQTNIFIITHTQEQYLKEALYLHHCLSLQSRLSDLILSSLADSAAPVLHINKGLEQLKEKELLKALRYRVHINKQSPICWHRITC